MNKEEFAKTLKDLSEKHWAERSEPILLSNIPSELKAIDGGLNYRDIIGDITIKSFVKESGEQYGYRLITHPTLKAKVGVLPKDVEYSFPLDVSDPSSTPRRVNKKFTEQEAIALLRALARLNDSDLEKISIPVDVIARMFR